MDWRARKYYLVSFSHEAIDMRMRHIKLLSDKIRIHPSHTIPKQPDETEERGHYQYIISCLCTECESLEYELRKAERNDDYCRWKEVKQYLPKAVAGLYI